MSIATEFFNRVATRILAEQALALPDLRNTIVLLPNFHVAQPLVQALMRCAQRPALLLPQMMTLNGWAEQVSLPAPLISDSQRSALLYQILRQQKWFENADLWGMTQELLQLFDELTYALEVLPVDQEGFVSAVQQAYQARQNTTLQLEARLVFELWHAMQAGNELDAARGYQQRLAVLADQAKFPLFVLRTSEWTTVEQKFLERYAQQAPVIEFDLRTMPLPEEGLGPDTLMYFAATSLEQEARAAAMQVRRWLAEGKREIAVVAQDRVAARRLRALLERSDVWVADETGWTLATLSVSTVLDRWLTAIQSDFYHHDLLDLLKSPYIFSEITASQRKSAVYQLEQHLRQQSVVSGLDRFIELTRDDEMLTSLLARLVTAKELMQIAKKKTLSVWLARLQESLEILGISGGLKLDDAGMQLLQSIALWSQELARDEGLYRFSEWRRWLAQKLDTETYRDNSIESPIRFTHLAATRWRAYEAVVLLGCDAGNLPSVNDGGRWFNDSVRSSLGLPTRSWHAQRQRDDLMSLLALNQQVLVTWQKEKNGEQALLSPYLLIVKDQREALYSADLMDRGLVSLLDSEDAQQIDLPEVRQPSPAISEVPSTISVGAYNTLVACPYQYYARHILRLNDLDEVQDSIEKRDYGDLVHQILQRFHQRYDKMSEHPLGMMQKALHQISEEAFASLLAQNYEAHAWLARWLKLVPAYLAWQLENEVQGWHYSDAESAFEYPLEGITLRGRIDRLDRGDQEVRIFDYKTQTPQVLRDKLREPGEDVQLACYAYVQGARSAAFVSMEGEKISAFFPKQEIVDLAKSNAERLVQVMLSLHQGATLVANGIDAVCAYCEVRGVCRKGEWQ